MPPLLDMDGVAKKCDRIVLQGTQEVLKVRHDENEVTFTSNNLHTGGNFYSRYSCNYNFIPVNIERNRTDHVPVRSYLRQKSKNASRLDKQ